jgi:hypothetical protein
MANSYQILTSRTIIHPVTHKSNSFAKGEIVSQTRIDRSGAHNVTGWATLLTSDETKILRANSEVDVVNKAQVDFTTEQLSDIAFITDLMMSLYGKARGEFCFGIGPSCTFKEATKDTFWFGVKLTDNGGRLMSKANKPVSLAPATCNFVAVTTLLSRFNNNQPLFASEA